MPEINSIPYESAEDLNKYIYDNYYCVENLNSVTTGTGFFSNKIFEMVIGAGYLNNSTSMCYYNLPYFNPVYSEAVWKCYINNSENVFAFWGYKETTAAPTYDMIESHAGFMLYNGKLYASVADGSTQQRVEIVGIDLTRVQNYKVEYTRFHIQPLPVIEEELGLPTIYSIERKWKLMTTLSNFPPENKVHYVVQYVKNLAGAKKIMTFNRFIYKEVYAD